MRKVNTPLPIPAVRLVCCKEQLVGVPQRQYQGGGLTFEIVWNESDPYEMMENCIIGPPFAVWIKTLRCLVSWWLSSTLSLVTFTEHLPLPGTVLNPSCDYPICPHTSSGGLTASHLPLTDEKTEDQIDSVTCLGQPASKRLSWDSSACGLSSITTFWALPIAQPQGLQTSRDQVCIAPDLMYFPPNIFIVPLYLIMELALLFFCSLSFYKRLGHF